MLVVRAAVVLYNIVFMLPLFLRVPMILRLNHERLVPDLVPMVLMNLPSPSAPCKISVLR